jgi:hypothetical protein
VRLPPGSLGVVASDQRTDGKLGESDRRDQRLGR